MFADFCRVRQRLPVHKKRADAIAANRVLGDVELPAEAQSFLAIQDFHQRTLVNVADRTVEETRSNGSIGLDNSRYPRCVASWRRCLNLSETGAEAKRDAAKLFRVFNNE